MEDKISVTPWKGKERTLVDFERADIQIHADAAILALDMAFKFEYEEVENENLGTKKTYRESTHFKTRLPRKDLLIEIGADHHHKDELCERDLPVIVIRCKNNFSFWLYLKEEDANKVYERINDFIEYGR